LAAKRLCRLPTRSECSHYAKVRSALLSRYGRHHVVLSRERDPRSRRRCRDTATGGAAVAPSRLSHDVGAQREGSAPCPAHGAARLLDSARRDDAGGDRVGSRGEAREGSCACQHSGHVHDGEPDCHRSPCAHARGTLFHDSETPQFGPVDLRRRSTLHVPIDGGGLTGFRASREPSLQWRRAFPTGALPSRRRTGDLGPTARNEKLANLESLVRSAGHPRSSRVQTSWRIDPRPSAPEVATFRERALRPWPLIIDDLN
jgi:hypothetical protein